MRFIPLSALPIALAFSFVAVAQQPATPAPVTPPASPPTAASMATPQDCGKMDKMAMSNDKSAMSMRAGCDEKAHQTAKKKAKNRRHNHSQFHKGTG